MGSGHQRHLEEGFGTSKTGVFFLETQLDYTSQPPL